MIQKEFSVLKAKSVLH